MLDASQNTVVVGALTLWCAYSLVYYFGETRKLSHIPTVGFSNPVLSYISTIQLLLDPPGFLQRKWANIPPGTKYVKVPTMTKWVVFPAQPEGYKEIARAPDSSLSVTKATEDTLQSKYTMYSEEIDDNLQIMPIRDKLSKMLDKFVPEVHNELVATFEDEFCLEGNDWKPFVALPTVINTIARISNRVLVGLPLCRNQDYIKECVEYAVNVFIMAYFLPIFPGVIRPLVNWAISPIPRRYRNIQQYYQPFLDRRRRAKAEMGDQYEQPATLLMWLADIAEEYKRGDRDIVLRMLGVNFGSIHTTSITFTHALFSLLSRPEDVETVRREVAEAISEEGWTKAAMDQMRYLDSFMKESQRFDAIGTTIGLRMAVEDYTLSGVFIPKDTMIAANVINAHFDPNAWGDSTYAFDPYRFIRIEEEQGRRIQLPTSTINTMTFGYGRHACPGRFFAAQEMKLLMAYFLHSYDLKLDTKNGERPKNFWFGMGNVPNATAKVLIRRRKVA